MRLEPLDFQAADVEAIVAGGGRGFIVAETGAGKTVIGCEIGKRLGSEVVLVIAVRDTHGEEEWGGRILHQAGHAPRTIDGTAKGKEALFDLQMETPGWYMVTPQMFTRWGNAKEYGKDFIKTVRPDLIIIDEAHLLANRESAGGKLLRKLSAKKRRGVAPHVVMSGTIVRNKFENFWNLSRFVYPERSGERDIADISYQRWVTEWCHTVYSPFAPGGRDIKGEKHPGAFARALPVYRQHFKREECCEFHPPREAAPSGGFLELEPPIEIEHHVDLTEEQRRAILSMEDRYVAWLEDAADSQRAVIAKLPIVAQIRLRQMALAMPSFSEVGVDERDQPIFEIGFAPDCASPKLDLFFERLLETDGTYLALTSSEKFAREAVRRIQSWGYSAELWAGTVTKKRRAGIKAAFMAGEVQVLVGVVEATSTGIDGLQKATNRLFWFDRSRDMTSNIQAEGRLDRRGQEQRVIVEYAIARGSMDQDIMSDHLARRLELNKSLRKTRRAVKK